MFTSPAGSRSAHRSRCRGGAGPLTIQYCLPIPFNSRLPSLQAAEVRTQAAVGVELGPIDRHRWHHTHLSGSVSIGCPRGFSGQGHSVLQGSSQGNAAFVCILMCAAKRRDAGCCLHVHVSSATVSQFPFLLPLQVLLADGSSSSSCRTFYILDRQHAGVETQVCRWQTVSSGRCQNLKRRGTLRWLRRQRTPRPKPWT